MTARKNLCENAACRVASVTCPSCHATFGPSVDRPAPSTAQPPPVLDLDALAEAERAMTAGPWKFANNTTCGIIGPDSRDLKAWHWHKSGDGADRRGVVALRNAAPALIAEVRALRAEVERLRADKAEAKRLGSYLATYITAMNDAEHPSGGFGLDELAEQTAAALEAL